uniref:Uncharacterized protein n=1 Tax=Moniliophthora roreri TaxID=221103 RepID=A0A0W0FTM9_MONRR
MSSSYLLTFLPNSNTTSTDPNPTIRPSFPTYLTSTSPMVAFSNPALSSLNQYVNISVLQYPNQSPIHSAVKTAPEDPTNSIMRFFASLNTMVMSARLLDVTIIGVAVAHCTRALTSIPNRPGTFYSLWNDGDDEFVVTPVHRGCRKTQG